MQDHRQEINRNMLMAWGMIVLVLFVSYIGEVIKGERTIAYIAVFFAAALLPLFLCLIIYHRNPQKKHFSIFMVCGYFIMYAFVLMTGSTTMVFSYILPMLSFMVLFHDPKLVMGTGIASLIVNVVSIVKRYMDGAINMSNSKDVEIQLALIIFCFGGAWISSRMYDRITRSNEEYLQTMLKQAEQISNQRNLLEDLEENVHHISAEARTDVMTGIGNRRACECEAQKILEEKKPVGVIYCDINGLKYKNDNEGHGAGDSLLTDFAKQLKDYFRTSDCFRVSGDEFIVLMAGIPEGMFTERARRFYNNVWSWPVPKAAVGWHYSESLQEAIKNAEVLMYEDKKKFYEKYPQYKR